MQKLRECTPSYHSLASYLKFEENTRKRHRVWLTIKRLTSEDKSEVIPFSSFIDHMGQPGAGDKVYGNISPSEKRSKAKGPKSAGSQL